MNNWFECKVNYDKNGEDGLLKKVSENYLVDAMNFTEAEERINAEMEPFISGEFVVASIKKVKINEMLDSDVEADDRWYKCKVLFLSIDEDKGIEKTIASFIFVKAFTLDKATEYVIKHLKTTLLDYRIVSVTETLILDVFKYQLVTKKTIQN